MAQKITSKNLSYDDTLPPFLARLRGQHAASASEPDPILASRRRAAKPRSASEEAEDAPLVVDEEGQEVLRDVTVGKDGVVTAELEAGGGDVNGEGGDDGSLKGKEKGAGIGGSKKRKVGKVVGGGDEEEDDEGTAPEERSKVGKSKGTSSARKNDKSKEPGKEKKKAKKIKLSFGDDDGE